MLTVFVILIPAVPESIEVLNESEALAPLGNLPIFQTELFQKPTDGVADISVSPVGKTSVIFKLVASSGPLFDTDIVNTMVSFSIGFELSTVFVKIISVWLSIWIVASRISPLVELSDWSDCAAVVKFVIKVPDVPALTVAVIFNNTLLPLFIEDSCHSPLAVL